MTPTTSRTYWYNKKDRSLKLGTTAAAMAARRCGIDGETPVKAAAAQSNATPSITELRRT